MRIVNYGTQSVTSFNLQATLDATDSVTVMWAGELASGFSVQLELDSLHVSMGDHVLSLEVNWLSK